MCSLINKTKTRSPVLVLFLLSDSGQVLSVRCKLPTVGMGNYLFGDTNEMVLRKPSFSTIESKTLLPPSCFRHAQLQQVLVNSTVLPMCTKVYTTKETRVLLECFIKYDGTAHKNTQQTDTNESWTTTLSAFDDDYGCTMAGATEQQPNGDTTTRVFPLMHSSGMQQWQVYWMCKRTRTSTNRSCISTDTTDVLDDTLSLLRLRGK